ncbi:hypothetical protein, partial [Kineococcus auxinigenes]|uniref:hypothetical protein n=1 Tax=unclassified Kineococcus TaxID=2621656 RepID=UPI003D7E877F
MPVLGTARTTLVTTVVVGLLTAMSTVAPAQAAGGPLVERAQRHVAARAVHTPAPGGAIDAFGASSVWKQDISTAPQAANSAAMVRNLTGQVTDRYNGVAAFNVNQYNTSIYTVPASQPRVDVQWSNCQNRSYTPKG